MSFVNYDTGLKPRPVLLLVLFLSVMVVYPITTSQSDIQSNSSSYLIESSSSSAEMSLILQDIDYNMLEKPDGYWYDAVANGVNLGLTGDDVSTSLALPFDFQFYDTAFTTVYIGSNGWLSFSKTDPWEYSNPTFPSSDTDYSYCIAPYWDDLYANNDVYSWSTSDWVVIQFDHYDHLFGGEAGTFQVVLHRNGTIDFNYYEFLVVNTGTVGLNYGDGVHYNDYTDDNLNGVTDFTLRFWHDLEEHDLSVGIKAPELVSPAEEVTLNLSVWNIGLNPENNVQYSLHINSSLILYDTIPTLENGTGVEIAIPWITYEAGIYEVTANVEPVPGESASENNVATKWISVSSVIGSVLWDIGHFNYDMAEFDIIINELANIGYQSITTLDPLTESLLADHSVLVTVLPMASYTTQEETAIEAFVAAGGGLFAVGTGDNADFNNLTGYAGIEWFSGGIDCVSSNITMHEITEGVSNVSLLGPISYMNTTSPAISLVRNTIGETVVAASEYGLGRIVGLADPSTIFDSQWGSEPSAILEADNLVLTVNIFRWLAANRQYNTFSDFTQIPGVVTYSDIVNVTCSVVDFTGVDAVELNFRMNHGSWLQVAMTHLLGSYYSAIIPVNSWNTYVEYFVFATNMYGISGIGLFNSYMVRDYISPTLAIISPDDNETVSGIVSVSVNASDAGSGMHRVEFFVDDVLVGEDFSAPFELDWDSATVTSGIHNLKAVAYDNAGISAEATISITTDNPDTSGSTIPDTLIMTIMVIAGGGAVVIIVVIILRKRT